MVRKISELVKNLERRILKRINFFRTELLDLLQVDFFEIHRSVVLVKSITTSALITVLCVTSFASLSEKALLSSHTELKIANAKRPSRKIIDAIFHSEDKTSVDLLKECFKEKKIKSSGYESFFDSVSLPQLKSGQDIYFVRPSIEPYCGAFYGAHLFRYWIVVQSSEKYHIALAGRADQVEILPVVHQNNYDIVETNCTAADCNRVTLQFDGKIYQPSNTQKQK